MAAAGAGRIHECLRAKREELTSRCAEEEAKLEGVQARNTADVRCSLFPDRSPDPSISTINIRVI